jgi:hypothetical protein
MERLKEEERQLRGFLSRVFLHTRYSEERVERVESVLRTLVEKIQEKMDTQATEEYLILHH